MKRRYFYLGILAMAGILNAETLDERKARLEAQIREVEFQQAIEQRNKEKEVEELERKLQIIQNSQAQARGHDSTQQKFARNKMSKDDEEAKKWFGKNRSGVFIGIGGGIMPLEYTIVSGAKQYTGKGNLDMLGLRAGYQYFANNNSNVGFRIYGDIYSISSNPDLQGIKSIGGGIDTQQDIEAANLDILLDMRIPDSYTYFGIFGGLGFGNMNFKVVEKGGLFRTDTDVAYLKNTTLFFNFGLAATVAAKHRFELYCKMPARSKYDEQFHWKTSVLLTGMYQYTF
ncbi:outer membrane beta-barrel protein [Helicobacter japonicus]|uniref:outer membrane beta-barrel protein n=1 Tax=Helicobacter japonicus TaxID=425400 RepID=UPI0023F4FB01|nr:outer membrane beta-barrel protein [Helicobacter japonicus]